MRYDCRVLAAIVASTLITLTACDSTGPGEGPPVTSHLECGEPGATEECTLPLEAQSRFEVKLISTSCQASGNKIRLVAPTTSTLTTDACSETIGRVWNFLGPYAAGTQIDFQIESHLLATPPAFRAAGAYPQWTLTFEDGGDSDFNDIVLQVTAIPVP